MAYIKPQVLVAQEFTAQPTTADSILRAWIVGPNAILHRYSDAEEKAGSYIGNYEDYVSTGGDFTYPGIKAGSVVDTDYVKLFADNAVLEYLKPFDDVPASPVHPDPEDTTTQFVYALVEEKNRIVFNNFNVMTNGDYKRDPELGNRDVQIGDLVHLSAYAQATSGNDCEPIPFDSKVIDYVVDKGDGTYTQPVRNTNIIYAPATAVTNAGEAVSATVSVDVLRTINAYDLRNAYSVELSYDSSQLSATVKKNGIKLIDSEDLTASDSTYSITVDNLFTLSFTESAVLNGDTLIFDKVVVYFKGCDVSSITYQKDGENVSPVTAAVASLDITQFTCSVDDVYTIKFSSVNGTKFKASLTTASGTDSYSWDESDNTETAVTATIGVKGLSLTLSNIQSGTWAYDTIKFNTTTLTQTGVSPVLDTNATYTTAQYPLTISGTYDPLPSGFLTQRYVIQVTAINATAGCQSIELRITSQSGLDDQPSVQATRNAAGTGYEFDVTGDGAVTATIYDEATGHEAVANMENISVGDSWEYILKGDYDPATITVGPSVYTGKYDDSYIITCVKGGEVAASDVKKQPVISVKTALGMDYVSEITVDSTDLITVGQGIQFKFDAANKDLAYGDIFTFAVKAGQNLAVHALALQDDLPEAMLSVSEDNLTVLRCSLRVKEDIQIPEKSTVSNAKNYEFDEANNEFEINSNIQISSTEFMKGTSFIPLSLVAGDLYLQYREWVAETTTGILTIASTDELDSIPGALDPDNPMKYGVYKALANANGTEVAYTAVAGNQTMDDWNAAFGLASGSTKVYSIIPMTQDLAIQNLAFALAQADSSEENAAWKHCIFNTAAPEEQMVVGQNTSSNNLNTTSTDGKVVLGTITQPMNSSRYIKVTVTSGNARLLETVKPGDELRIGFDAANNDYQSYKIDSVESNTSMTLVSGPNYGTFTAPQQIEVWHKLTKTEQVAYVVDIAGSFSNRRVELVWPDIVGENGVELPGYFLCAAIGGLMSGVASQQGLTRVELAGFDDYSRSRPYFTDTQLKELAANGVWVCLEDSNGTPYTMHAVTTSTMDLNNIEEMTTRNVDWLSFYYYDALDRFIGVTNVTSNTIWAIENTIKDYSDRLIGSTTGVGPAIINYDITGIEQDVLLKDRINVVLSLQIPYSLNNIYIKLFI